MIAISSCHSQWEAEEQGLEDGQGSKAQILASSIPSQQLASARQALPPEMSTSFQTSPTSWGPSAHTQEPVLWACAIIDNIVLDSGLFVAFGPLHTQLMPYTMNTSGLFC